MRTVILILTVVLCLPSASVMADDTALDRKTLVGLKRVWPFVFVALDKSLGIDGEDIRRDVELQLRKGGIEVIKDVDKLGDEGLGFLDVHLFAMGSGVKGLKGCYFVVMVELRREASFTFDPSVRLMVGSWSVGRQNRGDLDTLRADVRDAVDQFVLAYLTMNPKKR